MRVITADLWEQLGKADVILVATNSTLNSKGALVMGRGAAREAAQNFPHLPYELGARIRDLGAMRGYYGVILVPMFKISAVYAGHYIGAFQVKQDWRSAASLLLIEKSTMHLSAIAKTFPDWRFAMNFPGIGNGRLDREEVLPIIEHLPDNVDIYSKP